AAGPPVGHGRVDTETLPGLARLAKEINLQAAMIGYIEAFAMYTASSAAAVVLVVLMINRQRRALPVSGLAQRSEYGKYRCAVRQARFGGVVQVMYDQTEDDCDMIRGEG